MVDITHKSNSLRKAVASAILVVSAQETIDAIEKNNVPKGNVFDFSRAAGLLAIKKTSDAIPDCHPLPIEFASIKHSIERLSITILVEVHTIYKTGVEVEAMHGAAITALTMYDMLKPIDKGIEISSIRLETKKGGKTDFASHDAGGIRATVIICSDSVYLNKAEDSTGHVIKQKLIDYGITVEGVEVIPDDLKEIQDTTNTHVAAGFNLILLAGGTGLSERDNTTDAIKPLLTKEIPGIMEAARNYGQQRMPYAMLSRGVSGFIGKSLVITLPGSPNGAGETIDALFPYVLHVFKVVEGFRHDN